MIVLELCAVRLSKTVFRNKPKKGGFVFGDGLRPGSAGFIVHTHPLFLTQHRKVPTRVIAIEGDDDRCVCVHSVVSEVFVKSCLGTSILDRLVVAQIEPDLVQ